METILGILLIFVVIFIFISLLPDNKPKEVPEPTPDPDQAGKDAVALEVLRGNASAEEISERDGYTVDKIKEWIGDYVKRAVELSVDFPKHQAKSDLMAEDVEWLKQVCREHIGEDWEEKTHFSDRAITK